MRDPLRNKPSAFCELAPQGKESPVLVEVPHAGIYVDPLSAAVCIAQLGSVGKDADLYVDELFCDAPRGGAHLLYGKMSRYVCDLNRDESDIDAHTSALGTADSSPHGVVWRKTTEGRPAIAAPLPNHEIERRLNDVYRPYHRRVSEIIESKKERFGYAIMLCGHSMPSFGRMGERRADVVPGSRGGTTIDSRALELVDELAGRWGYSVAHDTPYRGGFSTTHYGSPSAGVHALQIEFARHLYMNEQTLAPVPAKFERLRRFCEELVTQLGQLQLVTRKRNSQ
jgi:N-formylglutamate amidohydrolase